ncbi:beta strand repeat-containing protein, partial [Pseudomonas sp.]|uniref:beta strand repeat-containing protein n=1 Tax=Pseudomonas sp. TaxID=306 RepID=UPI003CC6A7C9
VSASLSGGASIAVPVGGSAVIQGLYGQLQIGPKGAYQYVVNNDNPTVQALRLSSDTLVEQFTYTLQDLAGAQASATLTVTITGANDSPVGVNDTGTAIEAGGVLNGTPGQNARGNVLTNDTDVDAGDSRTVTGVRPLAESATGTFASVPVGGSSAPQAGLYGSLTINADGTYTYTLDNSNAAVQALSAGDQLVELFSYRVTDAGGLNDVAELRIVINGANDNPVASDDAADAQAASTNGDAQESNPSGNVIQFPSRPGPIDQAGGNGVDQDVDSADQPNSVLQVNGVATGTEAALNPANLVAVTSSIATQLVGSYGTLTMAADGSYSYDVDSTNLSVQGLAAGATLTDTFSYRVVDSKGLTDVAQLVITVHGVNDPPVAQNVVSIATEAGGVGNASPGVDPAGNALRSAFDPDGNPLTVTQIRTGAEADGGSSVAVDATGTVVIGTYGTLTIRADGTYTYVLDNNNVAVQALRTSNQLLLERFTYTLTDSVQPNPETDTAEIIVVIRGQNDAPVAVDDTAIAREAGGLNNAQAGVDPSGNVLTNPLTGDSDVDSAANGEQLSVGSVRTGSEAGTGTGGTLGSELRGAYGWLTLNSDGSYHYRLDNSLAAVQALRVGDTLLDSFSYTVTDVAGASDRASLTITIQGANDTPVAHNDTATATEAGGVANATPGVNPSGNVLLNDTDVDGNGETLSVVSFNHGAGNTAAGGALAGTYGTLTLNANGQYQYVVDNSNAIVQALRVASDTLTETFTYTLRDLAGATSSATLTVIIHGQNDAPIAVDDSATAVEAGGTANATPGTNPTGNLLNNDTDVDASDTHTLTGIRTGSEAAGGALTTVSGSQSLTGLYGTLTVLANGTYRYQVDNSLASVQALKPGDSLVELFTYAQRDTAGLSDTAQLTIRIQGAWDAPVANDDVALAVADNGNGNSVNPSHNVLPNDTDVDAGDSLHVSGIRLGAEALGTVPGNVNAGTDNTNGTLVVGLYGNLIIGADGNYTYTVDSSNPTVLALGPLQFLQETFTYQVTDRGNLNDQAEIRITIRGRNDTPVANTDSATAVEAGGLNNAQAGVNPGGNVISNDTDSDSTTLHITQVRTGTLAATGNGGTVGSVLRGAYGDLTLNADGTWQYVLDNSLAAVQALRVSGQTLNDTFTYTVADVFGASSSAELRITIDGRNDTPIAHDDSATAIEAGGVANGTPGQAASGNVLSNDTDVDSVANGESRQVLGVTGENGQAASPGQVLVGRYGQLTLNADGSYTYLIDNANPVVQALRTADDTLSETFTYRMADTAGATSQARLTVVIQGANDAPVAQNDSSIASDQTRAPQTSGNVLPNDRDVDHNDSLHVVAIRTGAEAASGSAGVIGQPIVGLYGTLVLNADGSYTYTIDQSNPQVLAAAGLGQVLRDVFTYTVSDIAGATDQAELVINLDIATPYIPPPGSGNHFDRDTRSQIGSLLLPDPVPAVFVTPEVERVSDVFDLTTVGVDGSNLRLAAVGLFPVDSLGNGLGQVQGQFVSRAVRDSREDSDLDLLWIQGRQGRTGLSADGLLSDPSLFTLDPAHLTHGQAQQPAHHEARQGRGFSAQLREAGQRRQPSGGSR